jgi:hypothetical protein
MIDFLRLLCGALIGLFRSSCAYRKLKTAD